MAELNFQLHDNGPTAEDSIDVDSNHVVQDEDIIDTLKKEYEELRKLNEDQVRNLDFESHDKALAWCQPPQQNVYIRMRIYAAGVGYVDKSRWRKEA
ncbi:hypothetical protein LINGRAHAP2_LOCUS14021 [Linum grandiflorum]